MGFCCGLEDLEASAGDVDSGAWGLPADCWLSVWGSRGRTVCGEGLRAHEADAGAAAGDETDPAFDGEEAACLEVVGFSHGESRVVLRVLVLGVELAVSWSFWMRLGSRERGRSTSLLPPYGFNVKARR